MDDDIMLESNPMITDTRIKVINPLRKILVGTEHGLFRITGDVNPETQWCWRRDRYIRDDHRELSCMASEPGTGALLAGFREGTPRLMFSEDGGKHWGPVTSWPADFAAASLATPGGGRVVIGSDGGRIFQGELPEGGWRSSQLPGSCGEIRKLSWNLADPGRWLAAQAGPGIGVSEDGGRTWTVEGAPVEAHSLIHTRGGVAIAATSHGAFRSGDHGLEWDSVDLPGAPQGVCVDVAGTVFVALEAGDHPVIWASYDTGLNWEPQEGCRTLPAPGEFPVALEADSFHPGVIYLGLGSEIFLVAPGGVRKIAENLPAVRRLLVI